ADAPVDGFVTALNTLVDRSDIETGYEYVDIYKDALLIQGFAADEFSYQAQHLCRQDLRRCDPVRRDGWTDLV
ncbi:hypothetical protein, partial [Methylobacterium haplocladii]